VNREAVNREFVVAEDVDTFRHKLVRSYKRRFALVAVIALYGIVWTAGFLRPDHDRGPALFGAAEDRTALMQVSALSEIIRFIPEGARDITYYAKQRGRYFEAEFSASEEEFVDWALQQGWTPEGIPQSKAGARIGGHRRTASTGNPEFPEGYRLTSTARKIAGASTPHEERSLAYDPVEKKAYLQVHNSVLGTMVSTPTTELKLAVTAR